MAALKEKKWIGVILEYSRTIEIFAIITGFILLLIILPGMYFLGSFQGSIEAFFRIGVAYTGAISAEMLMVIIHMDRSERGKESVLLFMLILVTFLDMAINVVNYLMNMDMQIEIAVDILLVLQFACSPVLCILFWHYQKLFYDDTDDNNIRIKNMVMEILFFADIISIIASPWFDYYYYIDQSGYHKGKMYIFTYIFPLILLGETIIENLRHHMSMKRHLILLSFCVLPIVMAALSIVFGNTVFVRLASLITLFLIFGGIQMEKSMEVTLKNDELIRAQIEAMTMQINPHFLYNTLASIDSLLDEDVEKGQELLGSFSSYLRANYRNIKDRPLISCSEELERLKTYIEIEKVRFENLTVDIDVQAVDFMLPTLTLQPLVENAIEHGICKRKKSKGRVELRIRELDKEYLIEVDDDGVGFDTDKMDDGKIHLGIENVKKRLEILSNASFDIYSEKGIGTVCTIKIPKKRE